MSVLNDDELPTDAMVVAALRGCLKRAKKGRAK